MPDLFGGLRGFAGPTLPTNPTPPPAPVPEPDPVEEDYGPARSILDLGEAPMARPGQTTTLWGAPERADALWGPMAAAEPVLGAESTAIAMGRIETETTYHEIEVMSSIELSTTISIEIEAHPHERASEHRSGGDRDQQQPGRHRRGDLH
ncbi:hypothetical protein [Nocardia heshunensis]